jgi:hypothetical protein
MLGGGDGVGSWVLGMVLVFRHIWCVRCGCNDEAMEIGTYVVRE